MPGLPQLEGLWKPTDGLEPRQCGSLQTSSAPIYALFLIYKTFLAYMNLHSQIEVWFRVRDQCQLLATSILADLQTESDLRLGDRKTLRGSDSFLVHSNKILLLLKPGHIVFILVAKLMFKFNPHYVVLKVRSRWNP
jgi:hypothetical protein